MLRSQCPNLGQETRTGDVTSPERKARGHSHTADGDASLSFKIKSSSVQEYRNVAKVRLRWERAGGQLFLIT